MATACRLRSTSLRTGFRPRIMEYPHLPIPARRSVVVTACKSCSFGLTVTSLILFSTEKCCASLLLLSCCFLYPFLFPFCFLSPPCLSCCLSPYALCTLAMSFGLVAASFAFLAQIPLSRFSVPSCCHGSNSVSGKLEARPCHRSPFAVCAPATHIALSTSMSASTDTQLVDDNHSISDGSRRSRSPSGTDVLLFACCICMVCCGTHQYLRVARA